MNAAVRLSDISCRCRMWLLLLVFLSGGWLPAAPAEAQQALPQPLPLVTGPDYKPFTDPALPEGGLAAQIVREAFAARGVGISLEWMDWKAGFDATAEGRFAATFPYFRAPEREELYWYSEPIFVVVHRLFHRSDRTPAPASLEAIAGSRVCIPTGYHPDPALLPMVEAGRIVLEQPLDMTRCFELLALGRVDFVATNEMQGWDLVGRIPGLSRENVATSGFVTATRTLSLIAPKVRADAREVVATFNAGLAELVESGRYREIVARHLGPAMVSEVSPADSLIGREVVLERRDGGRIEGTLTGIGQGVYRIDTARGPVEVATGEIRLLARRELLAAAVPPAPLPPPQPAPAAPPVRIVGSELLGEELIPAWLEAFAEARGVGGVVFEERAVNDRLAHLGDAPPDAPEAFALVTTGTAPGIAAFLAGEADLLFTDRPLSEEERARARAAGLDPDREEFENVVALDGVALFVHPQKRLRAMRREVAAAVFRGELREWNALGAPGGTILAMAPDTSFETTRFFRRLVLGDAPFRPDLRTFTNGDELASEVAVTPDALAFAGVAAVRRLRLLALDECGAERWPAGFDVETEDYALARRLFLYVSPRTSSPWAGAFAEFVLSDAAQRLAHQFGFEPLTVREAQHDERAALVAGRKRAQVRSRAVADRFLQAIADARRLTVTFRFATADSVLDARARRDLRRLARWVRERDLDPARLLLVGFADQRGDYAGNLALSERRARAVAEALATEGLAGVEVLAAGEEFPVACDNDPLGWAKNRRVEVWLR